jgi:two-component system, LytTR family, response regulator
VCCSSSKEMLVVVVLMRETQGQEQTERLMVRTSGRILFLDRSQITWIEAEGNYLRLFLDDGSYVMRGTMKDLEPRLGKDFLRVRRSHAVNVRAIAHLRTAAGELAVVLKDGTQLRVGHNFRAHVEQRMRVG